MYANSLEGGHSLHLEPEKGEGLTKEYLDTPTKLQENLDTGKFSTTTKL